MNSFEAPVHRFIFSLKLRTNVDAMVQSGKNVSCWLLGAIWSVRLVYLIQNLNFPKQILQNGLIDGQNVSKFKWKNVFMLRCNITVIIYFPNLSMMWTSNVHGKNYGHSTNKGSVEYEFNERRQNGKGKNAWNSSICERVPEMRRIIVDPNRNICQMRFPLVSHLFDA